MQIPSLHNSSTLLRQTASDVILQGDSFHVAVADLLNAAADRWGVLYVAHNHDDTAADFHLRRELAVAVSWNQRDAA